MQVSGDRQMVIKPLVFTVITTLGCTISHPSSAPSSAVSEHEPRGIEAAQLTVGGASVGDDEAAIYRAFGTAIQSKDVIDGITNERGKQLAFPGVDVYLHNGETYNVKCTTPSYATRDGARVGHTLADIISIYGPGETWQSDEETLIRYNVAGSDTYLIFHVRGGLVVMIELWFDYT